MHIFYVCAAAQHANWQGELEYVPYHIIGSKPVPSLLTFTLKCWVIETIVTDLYLVLTYLFVKMFFGDPRVPNSWVPSNFWLASFFFNSLWWTLWHTGSIFHILFFALFLVCFFSRIKREREWGSERRRRGRGRHVTATVTSSPRWQCQERHSVQHATRALLPRRHSAAPVSNTVTALLHLHAQEWFFKPFLLCLSFRGSKKIMAPETTNLLKLKVECWWNKGHHDSISQLLFMLFIFLHNSYSIEYSAEFNSTWLHIFPLSSGSMSWNTVR